MGLWSDPGDSKISVPIRHKSHMEATHIEALRDRVTNEQHRKAITFHALIVSFLEASRLETR